MSLINETSITLYNKYRDSVTKKDAYTKTVIKNATWHGHIESTMTTNEVTKTEVNMAKLINIRIPIYNNDFGGKTYIEEKAWNRLSDADRSKYFTMQQGDRVVKGECDYIYSSTTPITNLDNQYDNVVSISVTKVNDFGSKFLQSYKIGGK
jgi:hypothetical protein